MAEQNDDFYREGLAEFPIPGVWLRGEALYLHYLGDGCVPINEKRTVWGEAVWEEARMGMGHT